MIRIAIVEDDKLMQQELIEVTHRFFKENNLKCETYTFSNSEDFLVDYENNYNLILMDIDLPSMDGMSAVKKIREHSLDTMVIFVTSLAQYAIEGYKVHAFDYVLKPVNYYNFVLTLERILPHLKDNDKSIVIYTNKTSFKKILIERIKYIEIINHKLVFHTLDGDYETHGALNDYVDMLKDDYFELCNRCYLINLKMVSQVTPDSVIIDDESLLISRPKRKQFLHVLNEFIATGGGN